MPMMLVMMTKEQLQKTPPLIDLISFQARRVDVDCGSKTRPVCRMAFELVAGSTGSRSRRRRFKRESVKAHDIT